MADSYRFKVGDHVSFQDPADAWLSGRVATEANDAGVIAVSVGVDCADTYRLHWSELYALTEAERRQTQLIAKRPAGASGSAPRTPSEVLAESTYIGERLERLVDLAEHDGVRKAAARLRKRAESPAPAEFSEGRALEAWNTCLAEAVKLVEGVYAVPVPRGELDTLPDEEGS